MALFGTVIPSGGTAADTIVNGLRETNRQFLEALFRHSHYFTHFHLFLADGDCQLEQLRWKIWLKERNLESSKTITVLPLHSLSASLSRSQYDLFYWGDPYCGHMLELRKAFSEHAFPVVGRTHSLSQDVTFSGWNNLVLADSRPEDVLLCSSQASRQATANILEQVQNNCGQLFAGDLVVLPLGVDDPVITPVDKASARKQLGLPEQGMIFFCPGRLSPVDKADLHPLLYAFAGLFDQSGVDNCTLYICGQSGLDDPYIQSLCELAGQLGLSDSVLFNFQMDEQSKSLAFQAADVFVSLADSVQESFGIAPVEAMAAGLPVILSDWDGYRDLITDGKQGFLIPTMWGNTDGLSAPGACFDVRRAHLAQAQSVAIDLQALQNAMFRVLHEPELCQSMGGKGRECYQARFQWKDNIAAFEQLAREQKNKIVKPFYTASGELSSMAFGRVFSGYACEELQQNSWVKTTLDGRRVLSGLLPVSCYDGLEHTLPLHCLPDLLKACLTGEKAGTLKAQLAVSRTHGDMLILWAAKQGYVALEQQVKTLESAEYQFISGENSTLQKRFAVRKRIRKLSDCRLLKQRFREFEAELASETGLNWKDISAIEQQPARLGYEFYQLRTEQGVWGYQPAQHDSDSLKQARQQLQGLFNEHCGVTLFQAQASLSGHDKAGRFEFWQGHYRCSLAEMPMAGKTLGALLAFCLLTGYRLQTVDQVGCLDSGGFCDIFSRLSEEISEQQLPEDWESSSLALTGIDTGLYRLIAQNKEGHDAIELCVEGFTQGIDFFSNNQSIWKEYLQAQLNQPLPRVSLPFERSNKVLHQLEEFDLAVCKDLSELKQVLLAQARREFRLQGYKTEPERLRQQIACWLTGQHCQLQQTSDSYVSQRVKNVTGDLFRNQGQYWLSWMSSLIREKLITPVRSD